MSKTSFTTNDITPGARILIIVLGSWEQHGPHLPLNTDTIIIDAVVASSLADIDTNKFLLAPTIPISASDEHGGFSGGLSTGTQALADAIVSMCRSADWAKSVCIINGHGGNADAISIISSALNYEKIHHSIWSLPGYQGSDMHAGHTETSLMLHIRPEAVRRELIQAGNSDDAATLIPKMRVSGVSSVSLNGIIGDATTATARHGAIVLEMYTRSLLTHFSSHHLTGD